MSRFARGRRPEDPAVAALVAQARRASASRRGFLGAGLGTAGVLAASACAPPPLPPSAGLPELPADRSGTDKVVKWANWTAYLDYDDQSRTYPTLQRFERQTGIAATYAEDIEDNDSYIAKVSPRLRADQGIDRDIFTLTDWMASRVIRDQLCQPLDMVYMPNVARNLLEPLKEVSFDPGRRYSVTWQSGFAGIGYDKSKVGREIRTLEDLWSIPELKGRITVLSEFRDTVALIMQEQGVDISQDWSREDFESATDEIDQRITDGTIRRIRGNSYLEDLKSGNALAGIVWSGDLFILRAETGNPNWEFVIPESGGTLWSDNMMVPITSPHKRNAERLMDYYYDPAVAAEVAAWVNYVCPVNGAQAEMEKIDPELAESPFIFPGEDYIAEKNIQVIRALTPEEDSEYSEIWARVVGN